MRADTTIHQKNKKIRNENLFISLNFYPSKKVELIKWMLKMALFIAQEENVFLTKRSSLTAMKN